MTVFLEYKTRASADKAAKRAAEEMGVEIATQVLASPLRKRFLVPLPEDVAKKISKLTPLLRMPEEYALDFFERDDEEESRLVVIGERSPGRSYKKIGEVEAGTVYAKRSARDQVKRALARIESGDDSAYQQAPPKRVRPVRVQPEEFGARLDRIEAALAKLLGSEEE